MVEHSATMKQTPQRDRYRDPRRTPFREDVEPWYRQFWPWFLIFLPGSVVVAALTTVFIANRHADDLVISDYYKDGLAINRRIEKQQAAADLGLEATISILGSFLEVRLRGDVTPSALQLHLSHPLEADRDFSMALERTEAGAYQGALPAPLGVNWHWSILDDEGSWRLNGSLTAAEFIGVDDSL